ncbi:MAG: TlpA family protein disulfide reductase [Bacteroidota bacterium]
MKKYLLIFTTCLVIVGSVNAQKIRDFSFKDIHNNEQSYSKLKGEKITLIDFWTTWCKPCRKAMPELNHIYNSFKDQGVSIIGINCDGPRSIAKVAPLSASLQIEYPVLLDIDTELFNYLNLSGYPTLVLVDGSNKVRYIHEGFVTGDEQEIIEQIEKYLSDDI